MQLQLNGLKSKHSGCIFSFQLHCFEVVLLKYRQILPSIQSDSPHSLVLNIFGCQKLYNLTLFLYTRKKQNCKMADPVTTKYYVQTTYMNRHHFSANVRHFPISTLRGLSENSVPMQPGAHMRSSRDSCFIPCHRLVVSRGIATGNPCITSARY